MFPLPRTLLLACFLCGVGCATAVQPVPEAEGRYELFVLGIAQDGGLPHVGCERACCQRARKEGTALYPACLGIHDREDGVLILLEATPAVDAQVALFHELTGSDPRGRRPVDAVLLTHAHIGHYLGLAQFGFEVASTADLAVHTSPAMAAYLRGNGPWNQLVEMQQIRLEEFVPGEAFELRPGLHVTPVPVPHRDEYSDTMAYRVAGPRNTVLFVPDVQSWGQQEGLLEELLDGVTVAYLDATFYDGREMPDRDLDQIGHPLMVDTMRRLQARARAQPGSVRFIHLNHTNPALHEPELREQIDLLGFRVARRGERVPL